MNSTEKQVYCLDLNFLGKEGIIASYLIKSKEGLILIDPGPYSTFDNLKKQISLYGYSSTDIKHVLLTHIHFDHAGASWALAEQGAKIYVHPRGYKHMHDPNRLYASAKMLYGDQMEYLWGKMKNIPTHQLVEVADLQKINFGDKTFIAHHTPGHAVHHVAWQWDEHLFSGDVAGVRIENKITYAPCPPPDIHIQDWHSSIERIRSINPKNIYISHFGKITDIQNHLAQLVTNLDKWASMVKKMMDDGKDVQTISDQFVYNVKQEFDIQLSKVDPNLKLKYEFANPLFLSAQGLILYWKRQTKKMSD